MAAIDVKCSAMLFLLSNANIDISNLSELNRGRALDILDILLCTPLVSSDEVVNIITRLNSVYDGGSIGEGPEAASWVKEMEVMADIIFEFSTSRLLRAAVLQWMSQGIEESELLRKEYISYLYLFNAAVDEPGPYNRETPRENHRHRIGRSDQP